MNLMNLMNLMNSGHKIFRFPELGTPRKKTRSPQKSDISYLYETLYLLWYINLYSITYFTLSKKILVSLKQNYKKVWSLNF